MLTLIWTVGSHFFFFFLFFASLPCVCQGCACAKSLIVRINQELHVMFFRARCHAPDVRKAATGRRRWRLFQRWSVFAGVSFTCSPFCTVPALGNHCHPSKSTPVSIHVPKQVDCDMCRFSRYSLCVSLGRVRVTRLTKWASPIVSHTHSVLFSHCACDFACRTCHSPGTLFSF